MNAKEIKKYNLICAIGSTTELGAKTAELFGELCSIDFTTAFEMWEYKLGLHQNELSNGDVAHNLEEILFGFFMHASETKMRQLFCASLPLYRFVYQLCPTAAQSFNLTFLTNLILSNKINEAEEALRCLRANQNIDFGERMRAVVESVLNTYCAKNNVKKPELNRKQTALLLDYISKIKGPNKTLLTQRIKEL